VPPAVSAARLCAFNFGLQLVWGAVLAVSLQQRTRDLYHADLSQANSEAAIFAYALIAPLGAAVATVVQFAFGVLSDRRRLAVGHRREFYVAGVVLVVPTLFWFYLAPTWPQFIAAFALLQLAMNVAIAPYQAAIPDFFERAQRGIAASWMSVYQSIGNAAGLVVTGFVHDLRVVALALAAPFVASWLVMFAHVRRLHDVVDEPPPQVNPTRALFVLLWSRGLINVGFFTLLGFLLFYVQASLGVRGAATQTQTALLFITFILCAAGGAALAARPTDRRDKRLVVTLSCGLVALALAVLAAAHSLPVAYAAAALAGTGWGAFVTADYALATIVLPPGAMATSMGIWNVATTLPQVVAPLAAAPLVLRFDALAPGLGPRAAIVVALVEFLAGAALIWLLPPVRIESSPSRSAR
jgi:MFS family permease